MPAGIEWPACGSAAGGAVCAKAGTAMVSAIALMIVFISNLRKSLKIKLTEFQSRLGGGVAISGSMLAKGEATLVLRRATGFMAGLGLGPSAAGSAVHM